MRLILRLLLLCLYRLRRVLLGAQGELAQALRVGPWDP